MTKKPAKAVLTKQPTIATKAQAKKPANQQKKKPKPIAKCMLKKDIPVFFNILKQDNPNPTTELLYGSDFQLLIAVLLSAQSTDVGVNKATKQLFIDAGTPEKMLALGVEGLKGYIKTIGLYNSKAQNAIKTCQILIEKHDSQVPQNRQDLEALPGVGRKTANVILNTAFGQPTMAVDTHIFRVSNRTGLAMGGTVLAVENSLLKRIPKEFILDAHHWLILHGRYVCKARKPSCSSCKVYEQCGFKQKDSY